MNNNDEQNNQVQLFENIINWDMINNNNWGDLIIIFYFSFN